MGYAYKLGGKIWIDSQRSLARGIYCWPINAAEKNNELQGMERFCWIYTFSFIVFKWQWQEHVNKLFFTTWIYWFAYISTWCVKCFVVFLFCQGIEIYNRQVLLKPKSIANLPDLLITTVGRGASISLEGMRMLIILCRVVKWCYFPHLDLLVQDPIFLSVRKTKCHHCNCVCRQLLMSACSTVINTTINHYLIALI